MVQLSCTRGRVTSRSHALVVGVGGSLGFLLWLTGNFLKDPISMIQEAGRIRGEQRRKRGKQRK